MNEVITISSGAGWSAVYMSEDGSVFTVPLVSWALVKKWNEHDWVEGDSNCTVGMVLSANNYSIVPAPEAEFVENESRQAEDPARFCGYLAPGEDLQNGNWQPQRDN